MRAKRFFSRISFTNNTTSVFFLWFDWHWQRTVSTTYLLFANISNELYNNLNNYELRFFRSIVSTLSAVDTLHLLHVWIAAGERSAIYLFNFITIHVGAFARNFRSCECALFDCSDEFTNARRRYWSNEKKLNNFVSLTQIDFLVSFVWIGERITVTGVISGAWFFDFRKANECD